MIWTILGWIFDWRALAVAAVIGGVVLWRIFGTRVTAIVLTAATGFILWRMGSQSGARWERAEQKARDDRLVRKSNAIRRDVEAADDDELTRRLNRWVR